MNTGHGAVPACARSRRRPRADDTSIIRPLTPDYWMRPAALSRRRREHARRPLRRMAPARFVYAYATASAYITPGWRATAGIGAELLTRFLDYRSQHLQPFGRRRGRVRRRATSDGTVGIEMTTEPQGAT